MTDLDLHCRKLFSIILILFLIFPVTYIYAQQEQAKENYAAYLFTYFTGNGEGQEAIHYALSKDGFNFRALNNNRPIIDSKKISSTGGVRDPHILRSPDGKMFYMVVTDLHVPTDGWSNTGMVMLKSQDLVQWSYSKINIPDLFEDFADTRRVWAPQTIYDPHKNRYMVYFSMLQPGGKDIIYYSYANEDFTSLETVPKQLFYSPTDDACIDGDIIFHEGKYHLFFKTESGENGIKKAESDELTKGYIMQPDNKDQTRAQVEGSSVFKLINSDKYILMYDMYTSGRYQFTESTDLDTFTVIDNQVSMNFHPRHGTVIPVTAEEEIRLLKKWGTLADFITGSVAPGSKHLNLVIDQDANEIFIPVVPGTDLSSFDPELKAIEGAKTEPKGKQDFSSGSLQYSLELEGIGKYTFHVRCEVNNNPVLEGYYADPEIIWSEKDDRFYLYPTSDGFTGWSGTYFETFSSPDLVHWQAEGKILDLVQDVPWGPRNAWAPCAIEIKDGDTYTYYYYFTAAQKIGVAVADDPRGPFRDSGQPLINFKPGNINRGQEIDPDVFRDPVSGKYYLYWGNGYMAGVALNRDMVSIDTSKIHIMTPDGTFREGTEVFYRNGTYYFMWSENDTRSPDYRVRYGLSSTPLKIEVIPEDNIVIEKLPEKGIFGTGHNSVIKVPGKDEWYIVYHRFTRPKGIQMGRSAGYHREVCIDPLEFNDDGTIKKIRPSMEGIL